MASLHVQAGNQLCKRCGTPIDFLSSCPRCGTVAGIDPALSDAVASNHPEWAFGDEVHSVSPQAQWGPPGGVMPAAARLPGPVTFSGPQPLRQSPSPAARPLQQAKPLDQLISTWDVVTVGQTARGRLRRTWKRNLAVVVGTAALAAGAAVGIVKATSPTPPARLVSHQFSAAGAPFSVAFQAQPVKATLPEYLAGRPYKATGYSAFVGGNIYSATVYPFPIGQPTMSATEFLEIFAMHMGVGTFISLPGAKPMTFRGLPALYVVLEAPGGTTYLNVLAVLSGHIGYVLAEESPSAAAPGFWNFANTFHLLPQH